MYFNNYQTITLNQKIVHCYYLFKIIQTASYVWLILLSVLQRNAIYSWGTGQLKPQQKRMFTNYSPKPGKSCIFRLVIHHNRNKSINFIFMWTRANKKNIDAVGDNKVNFYVALRINQNKSEVEVAKNVRTMSLGRVYQFLQM